MDHPHPVRDRQQHFLVLHEQRLRAHLRGLVSDAVIEEHRLSPMGHHSDALARLLNYFRRGGLAGKYGLLKRDPAREEYRIVTFSGVRGALSRVEEEPVFTSPDEAYHAVFLRRVQDLMAH